MVTHTAVAGMQWGDEGKGKVVDLLAADFDLVVRYNGGANAGHTVVVDGERYALHLVPCGVLRPGAVGVVANGVAVDPEIMLDEIEMLGQRGVEIGDNLRVSDRAHVVMPYHKQADGLTEAAMAGLLGSGRVIGTTGRGIGPCYADKAARATAIRVGDLTDRGALAERLEMIARLKNATLGALADLAGVEFEPIDPQALLGQALRWGEQLSPHITDTSALLADALEAGRSVLFEGANGFLLDVDHGTYPYVTSSNSSVLGVFPGAGVPGATVGRVVGVVKAYTSRVGGGPFPTEQSNDVGDRIRDRGREFGTTTGRPRRCGWLDLVAVRYATRVSGATEIAVTLLDVLAGFDRLEICVAYLLDGERLTAFPADAATLAAVEPVYATLPGFAADIGQARRVDELPPEARQYLDFIADYLDLPVDIVGVGPGREQTLGRAR